MKENSFSKSPWSLRSSTHLENYAVYVGWLKTWLRFPFCSQSDRRGCTRVCAWAQRPQKATSQGTATPKLSNPCTGWTGSASGSHQKAGRSLGVQRGAGGWGNAVKCRGVCSSLRLGSGDLRGCISPLDITLWIYCAWEGELAYISGKFSHLSCLLSKQGWKWNSRNCQVAGAHSEWNIHARRRWALCLIRKRDCMVW